jgi:cobalt-zinc-cadmium efflux system protein
MKHTHSHNHQQDLKDKKLFFTILLNIVITVAQVIGGIVSGSLSLLSDALHNFSDVISLVISFIASKLSKRKASINRTFGYKRAEILAAFINASTLVIVAVLLIMEAVKRFKNPQEIESNIVIWLSLLAILANGFSVLLIKKDSEKNLNLRSAYLHLFTDMMASVAVLIGGLLMRYYQLFWVDSVLTFLIALYLIWVGYDLLKKSTKILMLFTPDQVNIKEMLRVVHEIPKVNKLHHVHVWYLNDDELHLEAHLDLKKNVSISEFDIILNKIEAVLQEKFKINHITIQPEFNKEDSKNVIIQD